MKLIPNVITSKFGRLALQASKQSPHILFGAGVVGVVGTAVLASRATLKLEETLKKTQDDMAKAKEVHESNNPDYTDEDYQRDMGVLVVRGGISLAKLYGPALIVGALSVSMLAGSHHILTKRNMALTAAYAALERGFNEYRKRVIDEFGEDKDRYFRFGEETKEVTRKENGKDVKKTEVVSPGSPSIYARFFDECSSSWSKDPEYNRFFVQCQQNYANDLLLSRGHVFLNEIYDMLGLERTRAGAVVGWVLDGDGDNFIDFGVFNKDYQPARQFVNGAERSILLDFNVDGVIYDKI